MRCVVVGCCRPTKTLAKCLVMVASSYVWGFSGKIRRFFPCLSFFFLSEYQPMHTNSILSARVSPQWLTVLRRLWPSIPWRVASNLVSDMFLYTAHSDCVGSVVYACLRVTCHLHIWQNDRGLSRVNAVTLGTSAGIRTRNLLVTSHELYQPSYPDPMDL